MPHAFLTGLSHTPRVFIYLKKILNNRNLTTPEGHFLKPHLRPNEMEKNTRKCFALFSPLRKTHSLFFITNSWNPQNSLRKREETPIHVTREVNSRFDQACHSFRLRITFCMTYLRHRTCKFLAERLHILNQFPRELLLWPRTALRVSYNDVSHPRASESTMLQYNLTRPWN